jgi:hypothetical protein
MHEVLHHPVARQQLLHFAQVLLDVVGVVFLLLRHRRLGRLRGKRA